MDALEKLGYVNITDIYTDEGCLIFTMSDGDFEERIVVDLGGKSAIKTFTFPTIDGRHADYLDIDEMKAIMEILEGADK